VLTPIGSKQINVPSWAVDPAAAAATHEVTTVCVDEIVNATSAARTMQCRRIVLR